MQRRGLGAWAWVACICACQTSPTASDVGPIDGGAVDAAGGSEVVVAVLVGATPLAGASVAVDDGVGVRVEATTGTDGRARLPVDWSDGPIDIVAWAPSHSAGAILDVTRTEYEARLGSSVGAFRVTLAPYAPAATIEVSGTLSGAATANYVYVYPSAGLDNSYGGPPDYLLSVPASAPFNLFAVEVAYAGTTYDFTQTVVHAIRTPEQPGSSANVVLDLDLLGTQVTMAEATGTFPLPPHAAGSFFATAIPYVDVTAIGDSPVLSVHTLGRVATDGLSVSYAVSYDVAAVAARETQTVFTMAATAGLTTAYVRGAPASGLQTFTLIEPPMLDVPVGAFPRVSDELVITNPVANAALRVAVIGDGTSIRAVVTGPIGADRVRLPPLPSAADPTVVYGGVLSISPDLCVLDPSDTYCAVYAFGPAVAADP